MSETSAAYEKAIMTERPAELLARLHGHETVADLAASLPVDARVLDVGAGASPFGREVAALRPDVTWVNVDFAYDDPAVLADLEEGAPDNLVHAVGDATMLAEQYPADSFDAVYSYWLLPHLSIDAPEPAIEAAKGMFTVTKPGGVVSVGPRTQTKKLALFNAEPAIQVIKDESMTAEDYADYIVEHTRLGRASRRAQKLSNEVLTPYFGTSRYARRRPGKLTQIYHPGSGEYVSPFSRKGLATAGGAVAALAHHVRRNSRR